MSRRTVHHIQLAPISGRRFQPTGFPDIGPAVFPGGGKASQSLLVESVQSMANHAEGVTWDEAAHGPAAAFAGLPYVEVVDKSGVYLTSSRVDAHRLASKYVIEGTVAGVRMRDAFETRFGLVKGKPMNRQQLAAQIFQLDPLSLIHGVFFAIKEWPWQPRITRALTMFIEADGVEEAHSGGVKTDSVNPSSTGDGASGSSKEGYGMVPHHRLEYVADTMTAHVVVDHEQIRSYGLSPESTEVLEAIVDLQIASMFEEGLRLRTACDLVVTTRPDGLASVDSAQVRLATAVEEAADHLAPVTRVTWESKGR